MAANEDECGHFRVIFDDGLLGFLTRLDLEKESTRFWRPSMSLASLGCNVGDCVVKVKEEVDLKAARLSNSAHCHASVRD